MEQEISLLIAMPGLDDVFFRKSVIVMVEQEKSGAMGFILTLSTGKTLNDVISKVEPDKAAQKDFPILLGGPVKTDFFWVLHAPTQHEFKSTIKIYDNLYITSGHEILPVYLRESGIDIFEVGVGYAGWEKDQLEEEIKSGSWWETSIEAKYLFELPVENRWETIFKALGVDLNRFYDNPDDHVIN